MIQESSVCDAKRYAGSYIRLLTDPQFLITLVVVQFILSYFAIVTKSLQFATCDPGKAYRDVQLSKDLVAKVRSKSTWDGVWKRIEALANDMDITPVKPRTAVTQRHRANAGLEKTPKAYFRVNIFYPFIDHVLQECETRFSLYKAQLSHSCWSFDSCKFEWSEWSVLR